MSCPDDGALRSWIDAEPSDHPAELGEHVTRCAACRERRVELRRTAELAVPALDLLAPTLFPTAAETDAALARVRSLAAGPAAPAVADLPLEPRHRDRFTSRLRRPLTAAATVALAFSVFGTPAGRSAASEFLAQFRSERFAPVTVTQQDADALADLQHLGAVTGDLTPPQPKPASLAVASKLVGFPVASPDPAQLPAGVRRTPEVLVTSARQLRFTFDSEKAQQWVRGHGGKGTTLPDRFDGASLLVSVPAAVVLQYDAADGTPGVVVGQAGQIDVQAEGGVGFEELRTFLLDLPGLSAGTRAALAAIGDWRTTLPLPIPAGQVRWTHTTIAGTDGLLLGDNTGLGSAVLWQRAGRIYGVAAPASAKVVRDVAASLH